MDTLRAAYRDDDDDSDLANHVSTITTTDALTNQGQPTTTDAVDDSAFDPADATDTETPETETEPVNGTKEEHIGFDDLSDDEISDDAENLHFKKLQKDEKGPNGSPQFTKVSETEEDDDEEPSPKKRKQLSTLTLSKHPKSEEQSPQGVAVVTKSIRTTTSSSKKSKKKNNNVWTKSTSRKGKKKTKNNNHNTQTEDKVLITPIPRFPDKNDDSPDMKICLSKFYKAEKVEISEDRLSAGSTKGYRMVRATRGVVEGPWYFEIKVVKLGETGHTRLGWSTDKGDLQAPVGYDGHSFGYRDIDGNKIHKALREKYGEEGYREGDVIGFYINLPEGSLYVPKPPRLVWYKGQRYVCALDAKEDPPKVVPGSEISFFKNGVCQGVAFKDLFGGRYYPAASMYTLPNQPNCVVSFNFGPDFEFFPEDFGDRPLPAPMIDVSYHGYDGGIVENGTPWVSTRMFPMLKLVKGQDTKAAEMVIWEIAQDSPQGLSRRHDHFSKISTLTRQ